MKSLCSHSFFITKKIQRLPYVPFTSYKSFLHIISPSDSSVQYNIFQISLSVQFSSVAQSCLTLCDPMNRSKPGLPVHHLLPELLKLVSIESVMPSNHLIPCHPLLVLSSIFPRIRVSSKESVLHIRWPKYWSFNSSISPSNEYSELISFRMDWFDLAVQVTLKSLLQHYSSKTSILQCSAFFLFQLSHPYLTFGKTKALTKQPLLVK